MLRLFIFAEGEIRRVQHPKPEELSKLGEEADLIWLDASNPTAQEVQTISEVFKLGRSLVDGAEVSRFPTRLRRGEYTVFNFPTLSVNGKVVTHPLLLIPKERALITIRREASEGVVEETLQALQSLLKTGETIDASFLACRVIGEICDDNSKVVEALRDEVEALGMKFLTADAKGSVKAIFTLSRKTEDLHDIFIAEREILDSLLEGGHTMVKITERTRGVLVDSFREMTEHVRFLDTYEKMLLTSMSMRNLELTMRLTRVMTYLTVVATVLLLPNTIATFFGIPYLPLNLTDPLFAVGEVLIAPWVLITTTVILSTVIPILWVIRKGWVKF